MDTTPETQNNLFVPGIQTGILEVLRCILIESPEALNLIDEGHIKSIISLLDKHGRNHKVCFRNARCIFSMQHIL